MVLPPLLRADYWFNLQALPFLPIVDKAIAIFLVALLILSGVLWYVSHSKQLEKDQRRIARRFSHLSLWAGIVGLILYSFTALRIPILSMRIFFLVWLLGFGWWKWTILRYAFKEMPMMKTKEAERAAYEKWLPKPKHK